MFLSFLRPLLRTALVSEHLPGLDRVSLARPASEPFAIKAHDTHGGGVGYSIGTVTHTQVDVVLLVCWDCCHGCGRIIGVNVRTGHVLLIGRRG